MDDLTRSCWEGILQQLRLHGYHRLQYIPSRNSFLALIKEPENLINLFTCKHHLLFYYSLFPAFYGWVISFGKKDLKVLIQFFYQNVPVREAELLRLFSVPQLEDAMRAEIIERCDQASWRAAFSVVPYMDYFVISDVRQSYSTHQIYETPLVENRVWIGSDSTRFAQLNRDYVKDKTFRHALELGSGTGVQLLAISDRCSALTAIDINPRAVELTSLNAKLNKIVHLRAIHSDLFEKLDDKFDLIISNPWFVDIERGGLEEIPDIFAQLDRYLAMNGTFIMIFGSFVTKDGTDVGLECVKSYCKKHRYELDVRTLGYGIETRFYEKYISNGCTHSAMHYAVMKKNDSEKAHFQPPSILRRLRDRAYLGMVHAIYGRKTTKGQGCDSSPNKV